MSRCATTEVDGPPYVPVAERRRKAELAMEKLRKKGAPVSPVKIEGRKIAATFWGKAWCDNLESYRDYENRLRARPHLRAQRLGGRSADRAARGDGDGQRLGDLHGQDHHRRRCRRRSGSRSAPIARAASIRWWNCCKGGFPRA